MPSYNIRGTYLFQGKDNPFSGTFSVGSDGKITGHIKDSASRCPRHDITGQVKSLDDAVVLEFLKSPTGQFVGSLAPIEYQMKKPKTGEDLSGEYEGAWRAAQPEHCGRIGLGYDPKIGEVVIWIPEKELENKTRITLTSR